MRPARAHYIRRNESARIPERFVILDAEALRERNDKGERQTWALAVATFITWDKSQAIRKETFRFTNPMDLWEAVSTFTRIGRRTVVYAHNLNYDLRITQALSLLPRLGWSLKDIRLDGRGSWSKWSRDKASLNLCDSASIFPGPLAELAAALGMAKLKLPKSDQREKLFLRCERDVDILADAISRYVTWMRTGLLGNWQMTGASQSWSHWRHSHYTHPILVHDNETALAAERAAMHSGRCEAWKWGRYAKDTWYEYDWQNSYPRIARDASLPTRLAGTVTRPSAKSLEALIRKYAVLADCEVETDTPCVPTQANGRTIWPVGRFRTTLWDPELSLLREADATIRVHRAWLYARQPALKDWAEWILSSLHTTDGSIEPWQKLILKHWSRALIGRFGMRYRSWNLYATAPDSKVYISDLYNAETGTMSELLQVGTDVFINGEMREVEDGCPQITGYIMSAARAKLWRTACAIGHSNVAYMDTDSLLVNSIGHRYIQSHQDAPLMDGLRSKARYHSIHIYGPRSYIHDGMPSVSGMPKGSSETRKNEWRGDAWRGAKQSIRLGESSTVTIRATTFKLRYNENRRHFAAGGFTVPYSLPSGKPAMGSRKEPTRAERLISNGYPALLAHSKTQKRSA